MPLKFVKIDLHVHTARGSSCAEIHHPLTLPETMKKNGIHGIVVTEHNTMWTREEILSINTGLKNCKIYRGMEISSGGHHFLVIGIHNTDHLHEGMLPHAMIQLVNSQGGIVILAHPYLHIPENRAIYVPEDISAIEVLSTVTKKSDNIKSIGLCKTHNLISVAGSDAHCMENVGAYYTLFPHLPYDEKELAEMIKNGKSILPSQIATR